MLLFIFGATLALMLYYKLIKPTKYWKQHNITHLPSWPLVGNMMDVVLKKKHFAEITQDIYSRFPNDRYVGYFQFATPALLLRDLELIKQVGIKEFDHFHDHEGLAAVDQEPLLAKSLVHLKQENWKQMRATLSPAFTSSKMKNMYHLISECAENVSKHFANVQEVDVEMKDIFSRFSNDVIATTAFGIKVDSLNEPNHEFFTMGQALTDFSPVKAAKMFMLQVCPILAKVFNVRLFRQDVCNFFKSIIKDNINKREKEQIVRPDLIHLLLEARKGQLKHDISSDDKQEGFATVEESYIGRNSQQIELTDDHITAQAFIFFFAGFETASTACCFVAYELAINPDIQQKLQDEIDTIIKKSNGKVTYENILSVKYLDQVVSETLRLWPPGFQIDRMCTQDFTFEPKKINEPSLHIEKGVAIITPVMALHRDPQYFPEPDRFDPERFSDENKGKIVPGSYLPFGIGPRNCIGSRFALLEIKVLFFYLLSKLDIVPTKRTEIPLKLNPKKVQLAVQNDFHLGFRVRQTSI